MANNYSWKQYLPYGGVHQNMTLPEIPYKKPAATTDKRTNPNLNRGNTQYVWDGETYEQRYTPGTPSQGQSWRNPTVTTTSPSSGSSGGGYSGGGGSGGGGGGGASAVDRILDAIRETNRLRQEQYQAEQARQAAERARLEAERKAERERMLAEMKRMEEERNRERENIYNKGKAEQDRTYGYAQGQVNDRTADALREAYINKMQSERGLPQQLAAQGIQGGAAETTTASMLNNYGNARNAIETERQRQLASLLNTYQNNLAQLALQKSSGKMADIAAMAPQIARIMATNTPTMFSIQQGAAPVENNYNLARYMHTLGLDDYE